MDAIFLNVIDAQYKETRTAKIKATFSMGVSMGIMVIGEW
jgi:hypothetical protein